MNVILGWLPWGDEAFPFHGFENWDEAGGHKVTVVAVVALDNIVNTNPFFCFFVQKKLSLMKNGLLHF